MKITRLVLVAALVAAACGGAPEATSAPTITLPTPIIIYVTPPPGPTATVAPTATAAPTQAPTPSSALVNLHGTLLFEGEQEPSLEFLESLGCAGAGPYAAISEGASLVFHDRTTDRVLGTTTLGGGSLDFNVDYGCRFAWTADVPPADYRITLANEVEWTITDASPTQSLDLSFKASVIATLPTAGPPSAEELANFAVVLEIDTEDVLDVHIKGIEEIDVSQDRALVWVESRYSTASVLKDLMYELWSYVAGDEPVGWVGDYVFRFGSDSTEGYLQSTTSSTLWDTIDDQLQWERATDFMTHGALCC